VHRCDSVFPLAVHLVDICHRFRSFPSDAGINRRRPTGAVTAYIVRPYAAIPGEHHHTRGEDWVRGERKLHTVTHRR
jgi:hypothetical protein